MESARHIIGCHLTQKRRVQHPLDGVAITIYQSIRAGNGGDTSDAHGHGTHCAGIIAGTPYSGAGASAVAPMSGLAPDAKLAVTDLGAGAAASLQIPQSMAAYYNPAWSVGARVHSDSWGEGTSAYTEAARQVDEAVGGGSGGSAAAAAPTLSGFVPVFAAGNTGAEAGVGAVTVMVGPVRHCPPRHSTHLKSGLLLSSSPLPSLPLLSSSRF